MSHYTTLYNYGKRVHDFGRFYFNFSLVFYISGGGVMKQSFH